MRLAALLSFGNHHAFAAPGTAKMNGRRQAVQQAAAALAAASLASPALGEVDYAGVGYLGGAKEIDVNNANIRAYLRLPGMYPFITNKIIAKLPYKDLGELKSKAGLTP